MQWVKMNYIYFIKLASVHNCVNMHQISALNEIIFLYKVKGILKQSKCDLYE